MTRAAVSVDHRRRYGGRPHPAAGARALPRRAGPQGQRRRARPSRRSMPSRSPSTSAPTARSRWPPRAPDSTAVQGTTPWHAACSRSRPGLRAASGERLRARPPAALPPHRRDGGVEPIPTAHTDPAPAPLTVPEGGQRVRESRRFPVLAMLAPIPIAVGMAVLIGNPRYMLFGLLSPVMMFANWVEDRRSRRPRAGALGQGRRRGSRPVQRGGSRAVRRRREPCPARPPEPGRSDRLGHGHRPAAVEATARRAQRCVRHPARAG